MSRSPIPLWPVPLAIAVTLVAAAHLAWWISVRAGHVPFCVPYIEGCTSISRAARHGLGNQLFRLLVLPCALLVGLHWWLSARWLRLRGRGGAVNAMIALAWIAALALGVYATFLGTEGEAYRFLRRYGVIVFFGCSYLAQLLFLRLAGDAGALDRVSRTGMTAVCVAMLVLGVVHVIAAALIGGSALQDRLENALEWHLGVLLVGWFVLHARLWGLERYRLAIEYGRGGHA
ncbi:hypothetical protein H0E84_18860 [Luteimonas sp. SJ-92]|uniref:DUF998 domain-containing protein n=1 Tax=Luteimonas salinisoli TaxID=2752307 RepID=A0A853JJ83_9GAMM|nr:hypothetical protein [Luteimonas salinisoli]NZA28440.1 hypothetical protein [Luteimonas salinisoli]